MKRIITAVVAMMALVATAKGQDVREWSIAPKVNMYANTGHNFVVGVGIGMRYSITQAIRIEPSLIYMLDNRSTAEVAIDAHYIFFFGEGCRVYPIAGFTANNIGWGNWSSGVNIGGGADYAINDTWDVSAAVKWQPMFGIARRNPMLISLGASYKF